MGRCVEACRWLCDVLVATFFEYDTAKIVHIQNKKVGLLNRLVQIGIIGYIIGYGIVVQKGYQKMGPVHSTVTTKIKGASLYNGSLGWDFMQNCPTEERNSTVFDTADYIIPPREPNSFFVMTNMWVTCHQVLGECPEDPGVQKSHCTHNDTSNCTRGTVFIGGSGPATGSCSDPFGPDEVQTCIVQAWCPTERENKTITKMGPKLTNAANFTVLVKNSIQFPTLRPGLRKRNILSTKDPDFLKNCAFNTSTKDGLYCPILSLGQIVDMIEPKENFTELAIEGGVVGLEIAWNCDNLERGIEHCNPAYSAKRLDDPKVGISPGYNFRYATYYQTENGTDYRKLIKAYGILFKMDVIGEGGMFDFFTLVLKLGSMIALLGIAVVISDVIVLYLLKKRWFYRDKKYLNVIDPPDETGYDVIEGPLPETKDTSEVPFDPSPVSS